jgi:steroid delta-isomerase-like uncharacterized protein
MNERNVRYRPRSLRDEMMRPETARNVIRAPTHCGEYGSGARLRPGASCCLLIAICIIASGCRARIDNDDLARNPYREFAIHMQTRDLDQLVALFAPDATYRDRTFDFEVVGQDAIREVLRSTMDGFGGPTFEIRRMFMDGSQVVVEWMLRGTFTGPILGAAPDSAAIELEGISIGIVENGLIRDHTDYLDRVALEERIGLRR